LLLRDDVVDENGRQDDEKGTMSWTRTAVRMMKKQSGTRRSIQIRGLSNFTCMKNRMTRADLTAAMTKTKVLIDKLDKDRNLAATETRVRTISQIQITT
jgi:predicted nucleotide-binding protein (sugar kinase/HSP70/actin superfamily)